MRVIAGRFKGRTIISPKGTNIRPTLDRVRETLFDIIQFDVRSSVFFDLFAGSGAVGIEAISRDAAEVIFCDNSRESRIALYKNLEFTKLSPKVWECGFKEALNKYPPGYFDFIFIDPPFETKFGVASLEIVSGRKLLKKGGRAVWEHPRIEKAPEVIGDLEIVDQREIGSVALSFYRSKNE